MLEQYIKEELVFLNQQVSDRTELFKKLSDTYLEENYVGDGFYDFLSKREDDYPTGLQLDNHTAAIPHGDPEHIKESFISVVTLAEPIQMKKMEDPDEAIDVDLFFVLGLADGGQHLDILRKVIGLIQQEEFVNEIKEAQSSEEVLAVIQKYSV